MRYRSGFVGRRRLTDLYEKPFSGIGAIPYYIAELQDDHLKTMSQRQHAIRPTLLAAVALIASVVAGCSSDDRFLPALLDDPMASYEAEGIRVVRTEERPRGTDLITRKPITAQVRRVYELEDPAEADQVFADAMAAAEMARWDMRETGPSESAFGGWGTTASKQFDWGPVLLIIGVGPTPGEPESDMRLRITLDE